MVVVVGVAMVVYISQVKEKKFVFEKNRRRVFSAASAQQLSSRLRLFTHMTATAATAAVQPAERSSRSLATETF